MSLNKCMNGSQLLLNQGEMIVRDEENVTVTFKKFSHSTEHMKGTKVGRVYLTNYRLIFKNQKSSDMMQELSVPFNRIKDFEIKQPVFGANYLQGKVLAEPNDAVRFMCRRWSNPSIILKEVPKSMVKTSYQRTEIHPGIASGVWSDARYVKASMSFSQAGGWQGSCLFEMTFNSGGAIEIGQHLIKLATNPPQAMYRHQPAAIVYASSPEGYAVPGASNTYFIPAQNASAPPMYPANAPPPSYPQAGPSAPPAYPQNGYGHMNTGERQKAMEAAQSTLPPGYDQTQAPPKYDDVTKKSQ